ncbi:MAG: TonB-dependent receptor domain-containing protein, partial [Rhodothermales bacterium]
LPTNVDPEDLRPGHMPGNELAEMPYTQSIFLTNPFWAANNFVNDDQRDRIMGYVLLRYDLTDWLNIQGRTGQDWYTTRGTSITPFGTRYREGGDMSEFENRILERNHDFLLSATRPLTRDIGVTANLGGNRLYRRSESLSLNGSEFNIPGLETISNTRNQTLGFGFSERAINSLYGVAEFSFREYLYLTVTGRNDWSSTLPSESNSFFYPSFAASFVASDALTLPDVISFARVRASWAEVGGDTSPYRLNLTYRLLPFTHDGIPLGTVSQTAIPLADLKPQASVGQEVGFDLRFFNNRFGIDFTYYNQSTTNQILSTTVPSSSGFSSKIINAGEMRNRGVELLLTTTPVRTGDLTWELDVNFGRNQNEVVELFGDLDRLEMAQARSQTAWIVAEVGEPYSSIRGWAYERDDQGRIVVDDDGLPVRGELTILGNGTPDWTAGVMNTVRFRGLTVSALLDVSWGGEIFSGTNVVAYSSGLHRNTLAGRAECEAAGWPDEGCWVAPNTVHEDGTPNETMTTPSSYFGRVAGQIAEEFVYDASYIKLRELQVAYRLPRRLLGAAPIQLASISLVARNLALLHSNVPNVDPESNFNATNAQGLELAGVPQTRSIGVNLSFRL